MTTKTSTCSASARTGWTSSRHWRPIARRLAPPGSKELEFAEQAQQLYGRFYEVGEELIATDRRILIGLETVGEHLRVIDDLLDEKLQPAAMAEGSAGSLKLRLLMDLEIDVNEMSRRFNAFLTTADESVLSESLVGDEQEFRQDLATLQSMALSQQEHIWADELERLFQEVVTAHEAIHQDKQALEAGLVEFSRIRTALDDLLDDLIQRKAVEDIQTASTAAVIRMRVFTLTASALTGGALLLLLPILTLTRHVAKTERELRESQRRFEASFNQTFQFMGLLQPDGTLLAVNDGPLQFRQLTRSQVIGFAFWDTPWWDHSEEVRDRLKQAVAEAAGGGFIRYEVEVPNAEGEMKTFDLSLKPMVDEAGQVALLIAEGRDITERREAEEALQRAHDELEERVRQRTAQLTETKERLLEETDERKRADATLLLQGQIVERMVEGVIVIRPTDGIILFCSPPFERMFGYDSGELVGQGVAVVNAAGETTPQETADTIIDSLNETGSWSGEVHNVKKDGTRFWCHAVVSTLDHPELGRVWVALHEDITKHKQAKEALRVESERNQRILAGAMDGFVTFDLDGRFCDVNEAYCAIVGYSRDDLLGMSIQDVEAQETAEETAQHVELLLKAGHDRFESRQRRNDGRMIDVEVSANLIDVGGKVQICSFIRDVTERNLVDEKLRKSEARFRRVVDSNMIGFIFWNVNGDIVDFNDVFLQMVGYTREDQRAGRLSWSEMTPPELSARDEIALREIAETGVCQPFEKEYIRKDGSRVPILIGGACLDETREGGVGYVIDITERKRAEEELLESRERFRQLAENIGEVFWLTDWAQRKLLYVSPAYETIFGRSCASLYENRGSWADHIHPDDKLRTVEAFRQKAELGQYCEEEYRINHPQRGIRWIRDRAYPLRDEAGEVYRVVGLAEDITARKRVEEQARQLHADLAHMSRLSSLGEMATGLAHELNQPLTAITNYAQGCVRRLKSNAISQDELENILSRIATQARRSGSIIQGLENLVRKSSALRFEIDVNHSIMEVADLANAEAAQHHAKARFELEPNLPAVMADQTQLQQVILNLVQNGCEAIQDTPESRRAVTVRTKKRGDRELEISVSDNGRGISESLGERLFEPFFTTKVQGIGMGLAISRSIVESHGGRLWATPNPDQGTTFYFTLPIVEGHDGDE